MRSVDIKSRWRKPALGLMAGALALAACGGSTSNSASSPPKSPIIIGVSTSVSGSNALLGQETAEGIKLAAKEINAKGGVNGQKIQIDVGDNACDPATGINAVGKLIDQDNVSVIIGSTCSSVTLAVMPIMQRSKVVQLSVGSTNPKITEQAGVGGNQWQYRLNIDDSIMAATLTKVIAREVKSVVVIASTDDYGRGAATAIVGDFKPLGTRVLGTEYYAFGQADFRPMLTKIKSEAPEGIVVIANAAEAGPMALQAQEVGLTNVKVYGRGTVVTPDFQKLVKDPAIWDGAREVNRWAPENSKFESAYKAEYGRDATVIAAIPYYAVYVLAQAIKQGNSADRASIQKELAKVNMCIPELGPVQFDDHHQAHTDVFITQWDKGVVKTISREPSSSSRGSCK